MGRTNGEIGKQKKKCVHYHTYINLLTLRFASNSTPPPTNVFSTRKAETGARDKDDVFSTPPLTNVFSIHMAQTGARDKDDVFGLGEYRRDVPRRLQTPIENTLVRGCVENTFSFSIAVMSRAASRRL